MLLNFPLRSYCHPALRDYAARCVCIRRLRRLAVLGCKNTKLNEKGKVKKKKYLVSKAPHTSVCLIATAGRCDCKNNAKFTSFIKLDTCGYCFRQKVVYLQRKSIHEACYKMSNDFLPQRGDYRNLRVFQLGNCIYALTYSFAHRHNDVTPV